MISSCGRQSKGLEKSVKKAAKVFLLPTDFLHFLIIDMRQYCALRPYLKLQWNFEKIFSK